MRFRAKVIGTGVSGDPYRVDLPDYQLVPGSELPPGSFVVGAGPPLTILIDVPDRIMNTVTQRPDKAKIRALYQGQPLWDRPDVGDDV